ncbi:MAG: lysophospholipid acyltransferase family protein [Betaproteobacteria bacterium]|nr:lysophospholipid acyltransferase family protein [Betaproteobacteria bacterium]
MTNLLHWLAHWPLWLLHRLGAVLGWLTYAGSASYRQRLVANAARAGLGVRARRASVAQAGRMVAELPWLWLAPAERPIGKWVQWTGAAVLDEAVNRGGGVILLTPHLGSFEVCAQAYAQRWGAKAPMTALYRPARKAWLREVEESSRQRPGLITAPANLTGVRQMIRALRRGQTVGLLPDQVPPDGMGVWAPFFGQPAYTMTLASRLQEQTGAPLLLMWAERQPGGRGWRVGVQHPQELLPGVSDYSPASINRLMEALILRAPEQYLWGYHRYKHPRSVPTHEETPGA